MIVTIKFGSALKPANLHLMASSGPRSRRERPAKPALTREGIVATAVRLMETEAPDTVTIRRLAAELDTGSASLYVYVRDTAELYALALDQKLGTLDLTWDADTTPWMQRLSALLMSYVELLVRYPPLSRSALLSRPTGENYLSIVELILGLLTTGGASHARAAWGVDLLLQTATATAVEVGARTRSSDAPGEWQALTDAVRTASPERFPLVAEIGVELLSGPGPARATWAFEALASGICATPRPDER